MVFALTSATGYGDQGVIAADQTVFHRYFGQPDLKVASDIRSIFQNIHAGASDPKEQGDGLMLETLTFRKTVKPGDVDGCKADVLAYLHHTVGHAWDLISYIRLCAGFWEISRYDCDALGSAASFKMNTLGRALIHEINHHSRVFSRLFGIIDVGPADKKCYEPKATQDLAKQEPEQAKINADNYAWYIEVAYPFYPGVNWMLTCIRSIIAHRCASVYSTYPRKVANVSSRRNLSS